MIAVVGLPAYAEVEGEGTAAGLAVEVAAAAVAAGRHVELVGKLGDDGAGDAVVVALGRRGVGHAALLRDAARPTPVLTRDETTGEDGDETSVVVLLPEDPVERPSLEAADVELALRYLSDVRVVAIVGPLVEDAVAAAAREAGYAGAPVVAVTAGGALTGVPETATILEAPADDDGSFGRLVGRYVAGLDAGAAPAEAFRQAVEASGWEHVG